jgi:hypothetical protein
MRYKLAGMIAVATLAFSFAGCNQMASENANTNVNANMANANANMTAANHNANENANTPILRAPTREDYEKNKERYTREAKEAGRKIGTGLNDGWLWTKVRFDLAAADDLRDSTINVDVENAVVTLSGSVASAAQRAKAESVAKAAEGVKSVKNLLKVAATENSNTGNKNANPKAH